MDEKNLIKKIKNKSKILIYGAGMVGSLVYKRLLSLGICKDEIEFVVTECTENKLYFDCYVNCIKNVKEKFTEFVVLISTQKGSRKQIEATLIENSIYDFIVIDDEIYYEMERNYVSEFLECNKLPTKEIDILFMASDNNSSSGAFLCLVDLNRELIKHGIRTLVVLPMYGNGEQLLIDNKIDYTYVLSDDWLCDESGVNKSRVNNQNAILTIEKIIEECHVKVIHCNTTYTFVGAEAALRKNKPYFWHIRECINEQGMWFSDEKYSYDIINRAEKIIVVSEYIHNCYPNFDDSKIEVIYDGIEEDKYYNKHAIFDDDEIKILMPGNIVPLKGQEQLIKAAQILKDRKIKFQISIVGSGDAEYISYLKEYVKIQNLTDNIHFFGRSSKLNEWYKKSDIVIICSRAEAFGRVTVEAQLSGCVVIGANCGATKEIIQDENTGILYELDDINMLAEKIIYACSKKEKMRKIVLHAQENAMRYYTRKNNTEKILDLYKKYL